MTAEDICKHYNYPIEPVQTVLLIDSKGRIWGTPVFRRWPRKLKKFRKKHGLTLQIDIKGFEVKLFKP